MNYRPPDWKNPYSEKKGKPFYKQGVNYDEAISWMGEAYEAGADALLDALRRQHPIYVSEEGVASINFPLGSVKGYFVFILEETDENKNRQT